MFLLLQPVRLPSHQHLIPDMTQHPGDQPRRLELQREDPELLRDFLGLHRDLPGHLTDGSGHLSEELGVAANPEIPDQVLQSLDPHQ